MADLRPGKCREIERQRRDDDEGLLDVPSGIVGVSDGMISSPSVLANGDRGMGVTGSSQVRIATDKWLIQVVARSLTQEQIDDACGDENTRLPNKNLTIKRCPKDGE